MTISSRTPEGESSRCPICGGVFVIEPSDPAGDAPCPACGHLLWWFRERFPHARLPITTSTSLANDMGADSLDLVELVMELEEQFGVTIPDEDAKQITTIGEAIRYLRKRRK